MTIALPTVTTAFASGATEAEFKTFLSDQRDYLAQMLGTTGDPTDAIVGGVPSGTKMLFMQAAAPTGWTLDTTHNDKSVRIVSGTGGGSGGSVDFSTVFGRSATDGTSLSTAQLASHTHLERARGVGSTDMGGATRYMTNNFRFTDGGSLTSTVDSTAANGSGSSHSHGLDMRVKYVDSIICTKN